MRVNTSSMVVSAWYATTKIRRRGRGERAADWRACREKEIALSNLGKSGTSPSLNDVGEGGLAPGWPISTNSLWMVCRTKSTTSEIGLALVTPSRTSNTTVQPAGIGGGLKNGRAGPRTEL